MKWATLPFRRLLRHLEEANWLVVLCIQGLGAISKMVPLAEAIMNCEKDDPNFDLDLNEKSLKETQKRAELAQSEINNGFPMLHANAVVGAWGALESAMIDFLVLWLINQPDALKCEEFSKIKIILADFETLEKEERMRFLISELERSVRSKFKEGVSRFESLLSVIGLSGPVDEKVRKTLYEMFHIRNIIVHCASIADRRFVQACPWLGYSIGDSVTVSHKNWLNYLKAIDEYAACKLSRISSYLKANKVKEPKKL
jgi:hypothetical protein